MLANFQLFNIYDSNKLDWHVYLNWLFNIYISHISTLSYYVLLLIILLLIVQYLLQKF